MSFEDIRDEFCHTYDTVNMVQPIPNIDAVDALTAATDDVADASGMAAQLTPADDEFAEQQRCARNPPRVIVPSPSLPSRWSSFPSALVPLICHCLSLRQLLVWSTVNRRIRSVVYTATHPQHSAADVATSMSLSAECWRFVSGAKLRWGGELDRFTGMDGPPSLELNGSILHSVTASIKVDLTPVSALASQLQQPEPTIADVFADRWLSAPLYDSSAYDWLPPAPSLPSPRFPYPLISPLATMVRSLRMARRVEFSTTLEKANIRVLLTALTVLPSFSLLHHLTLRCGGVHAHHPLTVIQQDAVVSGLFGCLISLPHLSSLELDDHIPLLRRHPDRRTDWMEKQFAFDALSELLANRLLHVGMSADLLAEMVQQQASIAHQRRSLEVQRAHAQQSATARAGSGMDATCFGPAPTVCAPDCFSVLRPQYASLQSLKLNGQARSVEGGLLRVLPSLVLLDAQYLESLSTGADETPFPRPRQREERVDAADVGDRADSESSVDSKGCSLRFLKTTVHVSSQRDIRLLAQCNFLHSLCLQVSLYHTGTGPGPLTPLHALGSLTQLRELTLELNAGSFRSGISKLDADELFDLTWLDRLLHLRYLHIKAFRHMSIATLHSLGLLPYPPDSQHHNAAERHTPHSPYPLPVPRFVGRVEELGLDVFEGDEELLGCAAQFTFDVWTRLQRCAMQYVWGPDIGINELGQCNGRYVSGPKGEAANAVLRERIGKRGG